MDSNSVVIKVCSGTGSVSAGGAEVLDAFREMVRSCDVDVDFQNRCRADKVGCRGFCARDVLVDVVAGGEKTTYERVRPDMVPRIFEEHVLGGSPVQEWTADELHQSFQDNQKKIVLAHCGEIDPEDLDAYLDVKGYEAARWAYTGMQPVDIIEKIKRSRLRGRGGAGFSTGHKWEFAYKVEEQEKYVVCNGNESDPGAFADRCIMEGDPHAVIEGMMICARAIGAGKGYIYIRDGYSLAVKRLRLALKQCYERGYLGKNVFESGHALDIRLYPAPGAFICGEATALVQSIEGKRAMPTPRLTRTSENGIRGKPTVINNAETLANVPKILRNGAGWFADLGSDTSGGTKVFSLTGKVKNNGLVEIPMGATLRDVVYKVGGGISEDRAFKGVQLGGPTGGCIPESFLDSRVDYESLAVAGTIMGSGGMVVLDETNCIVDTAKFFLNITQAESCGKCTPCRIGIRRMYEILERITTGYGQAGDIELLEDLGSHIRTTSLCGFGMTAPNPVLSTVRYFRDEYNIHIRDKKCPALVCKNLLTFSCIDEVCTGCGMCKRVCPADAIRGTRKKPHFIDQELCIKCGSCFDSCKFGAILKE